MTNVFVIEEVGLTDTRSHGPMTWDQAGQLLDQLESRGITAYTETTEVTVQSTPSTAVGRAPFNEFISRADWAALGDDDEG
ncbi:MAG TPA: hypothetical protein VGW38_09245 [Chloroflexota bacterium]|nr:hypothetical protein [Chloroflexota bacterium]